MRRRFGRVSVPPRYAVFLRAALTLVVAILVPPRSRSQSSPSGAEPRIVNTRAGYGFRTREAFWNPLIVEIENAGPERTAVLEAESRPVGAAPIVVRNAVTLPARARARYPIPLWTWRHDRDDPRPVELACVHLGDGIAARWSSMTVMGAALPGSRPWVLICEAQMRPYPFTECRPSAQDPPLFARTVIAPSELPRRPLMLGPIDILVLGSLGDDELDSCQVDAIRQWLEAGGTLVVVPGPGFQPERLGALETWLPVVYGPPVAVSDLTMLTVDGYPPPQPGRAVMVHPMALRDGRIRWGTADDPVAVERAFGAGTIVAVAVDLGDDTFAEWPGASTLWQRWVRPAPPILYRAERRLADNRTVGPFVQEIAGFRVPARHYVRRYLLLIGTMVVVTVWLGRWARRPLAGWALSSALALIAGVLMVVAQRPSAHIPPQCIELFQAYGRPGSHPLTVRAVTALYSTGPTRVTATPEDASTQLAPADEASAPAEPMVFTWTDRLSPTDLPLLPQFPRVFAVSSASTLPAPEVALRIDATGLHIAVTNRSPHVLHNVFVRLRRLVVPLGDLPPGGAVARGPVRPDEPRRNMQYLLRPVFRSRDVMDVRLFQALYPPFWDDGSTARIPSLSTAWPASTADVWDEPVLGFWCDAPQVALSSNTQLSRRAVGFVRVAAPLQVDPNAARWPRGTLPVHIESGAGARLAHPDGFYTGFQPDRFTLRFSLPDDAPEIPPRALTVFRLFEARDFALSLHLEDPHGGGSQPLPSADRIVIEDAERFYDPATHSVRLSAHIAPRSAEPGPTVLRPWVLRDVDLEWFGSRGAEPRPDEENRP